MFSATVRISGVSERPPVTHHLIGQATLPSREAEVRRGSRVEQERKLRPMTGVIVTESQPRPYSVIRRGVVKYVHPHGSTRSQRRASGPPSRTQEDEIRHDLNQKEKR